jgi:hypothetical protein
MPTTTKSSTEVLLAPGTLYTAVIGTTEPTSASATLASAWREVGYTEHGSAIDMNYKTSPIDVAEEFYPIKIPVTGVELAVGFNMAQASRRNLAFALNTGPNEASDGSSYEPPVPGTEVRCMLALLTNEGALWIFRQCLQGGSLSIKRDKAPNVALLPVQFNMEKPTGSQPFKVFPTAAGLV